jgi:hypothetical protein
MSSSKCIIEDPFSLLNNLDFIESPVTATVATTDEVVEVAAASTCETCMECGATMYQGACEQEYTCSGCGLVVEGDNSTDYNPVVSSSGRLRIVGAGSSQLQPDLYKSGSENGVEYQIAQTYAEFRMYRQKYIESGGRAFGLDACQDAAKHYAIVKQQYVKRSQNKKVIMAACFYQACLALGYSPSKIEISEFLQVQNKGITKGINFLRKMVADGKMEIDINADPCYPEIITIFALVKFEGEKYNNLYAAVYEIVQICIQNNIGTNSILRSKVAGAAFTVLSRSQYSIPIDAFCKQIHIRKNTIETFTDQLDSYFSFFENCYQTYGLSIANPAELKHAAMVARNAAAKESTVRTKWL